MNKRDAARHATIATCLILSVVCLSAAVLLALVWLGENHPAVVWAMLPVLFIPFIWYAFYWAAKDA